jgi:hypothetical protein
MARLGSVWAPPRGLWNQTPPVGESARPPVAHPGQMGPETRAGAGDPACGDRSRASGGAIRPHSGGGEGIVPLARLCVGCQAGEAWGVRLGRHRAAYGTKRPRWGKAPGPRSRIRARWDPKPALGLAIRRAVTCPGPRAGRSGRTVGEGRGSCPSRACAWGVRLGRRPTRGRRSGMRPGSPPRSTTVRPNPQSDQG